jgi:hypothetical protein
MIDYSTNPIVQQLVPSTQPTWIVYGDFVNGERTVWTELVVMWALTHEYWFVTSNGSEDSDISKVINGQPCRTISAAIPMSIKDLSEIGEFSHHHTYIGLTENDPEYWTDEIRDKWKDEITGTAEMREDLELDKLVSV